MTLARRGTATLLFSFTSKIEEAVILVPQMGVTEKLKAVQFWNVVSEKLQDIVNKNAADINDAASKIDDSDTNKLCLEMSNLTDAMNSVSDNSDFMTAIHNEYNNHFHNADLNNCHSKNQFPSELIPSNSETLNPQAETLSVHHMNPMIPQNRNQVSIDHLHEVTSLPAYNRSAIFIGSQPENPTNFLKRNSVPQSSIRTQYIESLHQTKNLVATNAYNAVSLFRNEKVVENDVENVAKLDSSGSADRTELNSESVDDSEDSLSRDGYETPGTMEESNDGNSKHNVGLTVSNSDVKEILENNEERSQRKNNKNSNIEPSYDCKVCGKQYSNHAALKQHCVIHKKSYSCTECPSVFATNANLIVHMRKHTGEKPYACHQCSSCFSTQGNLKRHVGKHNGDKPFKCEKCDSRFTEKKSLNIHMRRHTGERPYKCKVCGKGFAQSGVLESHMAMHLGIKKHLCETCGKAFRQKSQLRVHKLRHDNVKRFKCDSCPMSFLTKADLERHMKTHSGEKPYACDVCGKRFTRQQSLNDHMNRHYGIKPYTCDHCGKKFVEMSSFYKHIKIHKKEKKEHPEKSINNHEHEVPKSPEHASVSEVGNAENVMPLLKAKKAENGMVSNEEENQYIAVVLNGEEPRELHTLFNPTMLCNSGSSENNIVTNNYGVLTAVNVLSNASLMQAGFLN